MCGFEIRFIMSVSGHRQESSIRNYAKTSDGMKLAMSNAINTTVSKFDLQKKQPHHPYFRLPIQKICSLS